MIENFSKIKKFPITYEIYYYKFIMTDSIYPKLRLILMIESYINEINLLIISQT